VCINICIYIGLTLRSLLRQAERGLWFRNRCVLCVFCVFVLDVCVLLNRCVLCVFVLDVCVCASEPVCVMCVCL